VAYSEVATPVAGAAAFQSTDDASILSQSAILLGLGVELRGEGPLPEGRLQALAGDSLPELLPKDDLAVLNLPPLPVSRGRIDAQRIRGGMESRYGMRTGAMLADAEAFSAAGTILPDVARQLYREPSAVAAAELMEASLSAPHELVRVSAAAAYFDRSSEPARLIAILEKGTRSADELTTAVAATALAQIAPEDRALDDLVTPKESASASGVASHATVLVAGTWALNSLWWKPGGIFHTYLTGVLPPLPRTVPGSAGATWSPCYAAGDFYSWSGGYSDAARALAAADLVQWVNGHSAAGLDLITHSHGGNVAMLATQPGMAMTPQEIVLLSCPVHFPKYAPDFSKIQKIVSIRVRLDLVILADRGGQRFNNPRIQENILPVWFDHFATHDPLVWSKYTVPAML
jgi:hypothetical protein